MNARPTIPRRERDGLSARGYFLIAGGAALAITALALRLKPAPLPGKVAPPADARPALTSFQTRLAPDRPADPQEPGDAPPLKPGYRREVTRPRAVADISAAAKAPSDDNPPPGQAASPESVESGAPWAGPANSRKEERGKRPEIFRMPAEAHPLAGAGEPRTDAHPPRPASTRGAAAPYGRLLSCVLVETLDSATLRSEPILALAARDLDWNGQVVIPAGTEVFGFAAAQPVIDARGVGRLVDTGEWTLVPPRQFGRREGPEIHLKGRALDRREGLALLDGTPRTWGIDDGAAGLIGYTLSTLDDEEIRLFAAAALGGAAQGAAAVAGRPPTSWAGASLGGTVPSAGAAAESVAGTAAGQGLAEAMNQFAGRIRQEIARRGVYVRVPAGEEFYLFIEQDIDPDTAVAGAGPSATPSPAMAAVQSRSK